MPFPWGETLVLLCLCCGFVFKGCFLCLPFPPEKIQDHSLTQTPVEGESPGLETPWGLSCWGKGARGWWDRDEEQLQDGLWGAAPTPSLSPHSCGICGANKPRWGKTPTPPEPHPLCAPAQPWELPWLGINIPCPGRASSAPRGTPEPPCPAPPAPRAPHQSSGEPLMCFWGQQGGAWLTELSHPTDVGRGPGAVQFTLLPSPPRV